MTISAQKISVSLSKSLISFVKEYKNEHHLKSDSEVMAIALRNLEKSYLELCYAQSAKEMKNDLILQKEADLWEKTAADGIETEDW